MSQVKKDLNFLLGFGCAIALVAVVVGMAFYLRSSKEAPSKQPGVVKRAKPVSSDQVQPGEPPAATREEQFESAWKESIAAMVNDPAWRCVLEDAGSGVQNTSPFRVSSDRQMFAYMVDGEPALFNFDSIGGGMVEVVAPQNTGGAPWIYLKPGEYRISVTAFNGKWKVAVFEPVD